MSDKVHVYISTACHHVKHTSCREWCKWCKEPCVCKCHAVKAVPLELNEVPLLERQEEDFKW